MGLSRDGWMRELLMRKSMSLEQIQKRGGSLWFTQELVRQCSSPDEQGNGGRRHGQQRRNDDFRAQLRQNLSSGGRQWRLAGRLLSHAYLLRDLLASSDRLAYHSTNHNLRPILSGTSVECCGKMELVVTHLRP
jgi:hypothetical protein